MGKNPLKLLEEMVNIDSGSGDVEGLAKVAGLIERSGRELGCSFQTLTAPDGSRHYYLSRGQGKRVLLVAHLDTVFPKGTAAARPFTVIGDTAYGAGVSDCKSGVVTILAALEILNQTRWPHYEIGCLFNTDEELSSPGSREFIVKLARDAKAVLVAEPAEGNTLTIARKGIGRFVLKVSGKAAHSGSNYQDGCSAILELAHKVVAIHALSDIEKGITFNAGVIKGGSKPNIISDYAEAEIDLRIKTAVQEGEALSKLEEVVSRRWVAGTNSRLEGAITRPPMEITPENIVLYQRFKKIGDELGLDLGMLASGGGSDANLAAALGVPTIDGLGPVGGGHHSPEEFMSVSSFYQRIRLLAEYLLQLPGC